MRRTTLAVVLMVCAASAQATVYNLENLYPNRIYTFAGDGLSGAFSDTINFKFDHFAPFNFDYYVYDLNIGQFVVTANGPSGSHTSPIHALSASRTESYFGAGSYSLSVSGIGGSYLVDPSGAQTFRPGNYYLEFTTTAPAASTWLMLIIGAAFMAWRLRYLAQVPRLPRPR